MELRAQITHADQVVGRRREGKHPPDLGRAAMAGLAQPADGLKPAEDLGATPFRWTV